MARVIRIDDEVWTWLQSHARPLEDTPNSVLRRIAGLEAPGRDAIEADVPPTTSVSQYVPSARPRRVRSDHTTQAEFREPILVMLHRHNGHLERPNALRELEAMLGNQLTNADRADIESGTIRWQKSAEWQVHMMRRAGLLEPVEKSRSGVWKLSSRGTALAARLVATREDGIEPRLTERAEAAAPLET